MRLGQMDRSLLAMRKAMDLRRALGLELALVQSLTNIATLYALTGDYQEAESLLRTALQQIRDLDEATLLNRILINLSYVLVEAGASEKALPLLEESRVLARASDNSYFLAHGLHNTGEALVRMGQYQEAAPYLNQSLTLSTRLGIKSVTGDNFQYLAQIALADGRVDDAFTLANRALDLALETKENHRLRDMHALLSQIERAQGNIESALQHLEEHIVLKDAVFNQARDRTLSLLRAEFDLAEKDHEIALLNRDQKIQALQLEKEKSYRQVTVGSLAIMVLIAGGLAWSLRSNILARRIAALKAIELEKTKDALAKADRAKSDLLATTTHEVRTPLNGMLGMAQVLLKSPLNPAQRRQAEAIRQAGQAMLVILNDLLDISKIEAGRVDLEPCVIDLKSLVSSYSDLWQPNAQERGLTFDVHLAADLPDRIIADPKRIQQVLFNLISNAIKFTQYGGVTVRISRAEKQEDAGKITLMFEVVDSGPGIADDVQAILFEQYNQGKLGAGGDIQGTGLGLHICRQLTLCLGGDIGFNSEEGKGSRFWFAVPVEIASDSSEPCQLCSSPSGDAPAAVPDLLCDAPDQPDDDPVGSPDAQQADGPLRILVADDNDMNKQLMSAILGSWNVHYEIVDDGAQAVDQVKANAWDVVLMDAYMPVLDGVRATQTIRSLKGSGAQTPIIALTASTQSDDQARFGKAGFNGFVPKPLNLDVLAAEITRLTGRSVA